MSSSPGLEILASVNRRLHPPRCLVQEQHPLLRNFDGNSHLPLCTAATAPAYPLLHKVDRWRQEALTLPGEQRGEHDFIPLWRHGVCSTDGPDANGDTTNVLLLALADKSMGISYSISGLHPYAAPPIYLST